MKGRPVQIENLFPGMQCRILVHIGLNCDGPVAVDDTGLIFLSGRFSYRKWLKNAPPLGRRTSLVGHKSLNRRDPTFVVEEVEIKDYLNYEL